MKIDGKPDQKKLKVFYVIVIMLVSFGTHFIFYGRINRFVFDECYFTKFVSSYYTRDYYFDIHPPFAKMLIGSFAKGFGYQPLPDQYNPLIDDRYPDNSYLYLRFLPTLAGALLPLVIFLLAQKLNFGPHASFLAGFLVAIENGLIVQSRFVLTDSLLFFFGFCSILVYLYAKSKKDRKLLLFSAVLAGITISIKWTGLSFPGLIIFSEMYDLHQKNNLRKEWFKKIKTYLVVMISIYVLIFLPHNLILSHNSPISRKEFSGLSQKIIGSNGWYKVIGFPVQFFETNLRMMAGNVNLSDKSDPKSSNPLMWPLMKRPIKFWQDESQGKYVVLFGNYFIWTTTTITVFLSFVSLFWRRTKKRADPTFTFLMVGYLINFVPFLFIGRPMYLYHYFTSYVFAILIFAYQIKKCRYFPAALIAMVILSLGFFFIFAPLTYGLTISNPTLSRMVSALYLFLVR